MKTLNNSSKLTKHNWRGFVLRAFTPVAGAELEVVAMPRFKCGVCKTSRVAFNRQGIASCYECDTDETVPHQSVRIDRGYELAYVAAPGFPRLAVAAVAGSHLVSPVAWRGYSLGKCDAAEFVLDLRARCLPAWNLSVDDDGVWRRPDRTRPDGYDVADLAFGNRGGIWSDTEIKAFSE